MRTGGQCATLCPHLFQGLLLSNGQNRLHPEADGQNRALSSMLVPGRLRIGQRPPRPDTGRIPNGSTRFWLLAPPSATRCQLHLPDHGRPIRPAAHALTRHRVIAGRGGAFLRSRGRACDRTLTSLCSLYVMYVCIGYICRCMHVYELCTSCSTAVSHTPYICRSTTELIKSDSLHPRR